MKKIVTLIFAATLLLSCDKFLDINPKAEVINKEMFSTRQGCEDALWGVYGDLRSTKLYGEYLSWGIFEPLAQNLQVSTQFSSRHPLTKYNYNDVKPILKDIWQKGYEVIGYTNNIITNLEAMSPNSYPLYNLYLGEAYGIRSALLFDLVRTFAADAKRGATLQGIPYVTEYSYKHTPFSTVGEVYQKLVADLKKAQQLLEADKANITFPRTKEAEIAHSFLKGRELHFNYYAATALLARVYWTMGDLTNAKTEAQKVIDSNLFPLVSKDEVTNIIAGALSAKETIWGLYSTDYFSTTQTRLASGASWANMTPYQTSLGGNYPLPYVNVYSQYLNNNAGVDMRLNWFRPITNGGTINYCLKSADWARINTSTNTPEGRGQLEGISLLRSVEMYYIVAEALLEQGNKTEAARYINMVLTSRGLTALSERVPALEPTIELLYNERHKEFFGEGMRWFEMKKRNMDIVSNTEFKTLPASDKIYILPIPTEEFENRNTK